MAIATRPTIPTRNAVLRAGHIEALRSRLDGTLITRASADYDDARRVLYITVDRHPLAIVRAASTQDVVEAVRYARDHALPLAVRSGGHSLAYYSMIDDAIVVDLSGMTRVSIDPEARIARVQAGATSGLLAEPANAHGLALSTGDTHSVVFGGLTTGGGIGFMVRKYGLAIDNLLSAHVVTATGDVLTASADEHPDLFWAIRGGGGNFGIVTEFTFRLAPVGQILGGALLLPASREVIRGYLDYTASAPDELSTIANLMYAPPAPFVPQEHVGDLVLAILVCWTGSIADGERALAPLRALATPVADAVSPMPYPAIYQFTAQQAAPHGASIRSMFAEDLSDAALDATLAAMKDSTSPFSLVQFRSLGGTMARVDNDATAFAHRDKRYFVAIIGLWLDAAEDASVHSAWTEALWQAIRHEGSGVYVNFLQEEGEDRIREAYPAATFARLVAIKRRYDPENLFRFNQNIVPSQGVDSGRAARYRKFGIGEKTLVSN
jgi:FAD/FMN-containing dehydrogenase